MITASQIKMARSALRWTVDDLAKNAQIGRGTVLRLESGKEGSALTMASVQQALENAGIIFVNTEGRQVVVAPEVQSEACGKLVHEFWLWLSEAPREAASAADLLLEVDPDSEFASAIAQILPEMGGVKLRTPKNLAIVLNLLSDEPINVDGVTFTIISEGDHGDEILAARWKVVRA